MENLSENIKNLFGEMIDDGTFESILKERMKKGIEDAFDRSICFGVVRDVIEKRIKEVLVPSIETYDFEKYIIKLDSILTEIVNETSLKDNKRILKNFQFLMIEPEDKETTISKIFEAYKNFVASYRREFEPCQEIEAAFRVNFEPERRWDNYDYATIEFYVDDARRENFYNKTIKIRRYKKSAYHSDWTIFSFGIGDISSLSYMDDFDVLIQRIARAEIKIEIDAEEDECSISGRPVEEDKC